MRMRINQLEHDNQYFQIQNAGTTSSSSSNQLKIKTSKYKFYIGFDQGSNLQTQIWINPHTQEPLIGSECVFSKISDEPVNLILKLNYGCWLIKATSLG